MVKGEGKEEEAGLSSSFYRGHALLPPGARVHSELDSSWFWSFVGDGEVEAWLCVCVWCACFSKSVGVSLCVCVCVFACVVMCVHACMCVCVCVSQSTNHLRPSLSFTSFSPVRLSCPSPVPLTPPPPFILSSFQTLNMSALG